MEYCRGGTDLARFCTAMINLSHDELLHIFSFLDSRYRCAVLPKVCKTFLQALKGSGEYNSQLLSGHVPEAASKGPTRPNGTAIEPLRTAQFAGRSPGFL
jgi:hypothetical protein